MQTIESGTTDQYAYFRTFTGTTSFTVRSKRAGAASVLWTGPAPTIAEDGGSQGLFSILVDRQTTMTAGKGSETLWLEIKPAGQPTVDLQIELRASYADRVMTRLGAPAGASVSADIAAAFARMGAPAGASLAADIASILTRLGAPAGASVSADIAGIQTKLGTPAGASVAVDIASVFSRIGAPALASIAADIASALTRLGSPSGASVSADIAAIFARIGAPALASIAADLANVLAQVGNVYTRIGAPAGASLSADVGTNLTAVNNISAKIGTPVVTVSADLAALATALASDLGQIIAAIAALNNVSAATVKAQMVAALAADLYAEPAGVPSASAAITTKLGYLFAALRDGIRIDGSNKTFLDQSGIDMWKKPLSDGGGTYLESTAISP